MKSPDKAQLKAAALDYIQKHRQAYLDLGRDFYRHPELAFRETYTAQRLLDEFSALGLAEVTRTAHTGVTARLPLGRPGRNFGVIAELDALYLPNHPDADTATGAAHVCGHHIQTTALAGVARALKESGVAQFLAGTVSFFGCPAEEGSVPKELYDTLCREEGFHSASGKQEMLARGCFAGVEGLLSTHALINDSKVTQPALLSAGCDGYNRWVFDIRGRTAHPTMDPSKGINALNGAVLALHALQCVRESLALDDYSIILTAMDEIVQAPGAIPDYVRLRVTTKSKTPAILEEIDGKVCRAVQGAAGSIGCQVDCEKIPGYQSFIADEALSRVYMDNCQAITGTAVPVRPHGYYSNDLGDVSKQVPTSQIVVGGFSGALHSERFRIEDEEMAYLLPSKMMTCTLIDLLYAE
ncbi:amidohydrolase [Pseudoflavonifractor sp. 524-17]|uniref:amidohydrolase n=1 Tax=Pseudoflavonifractor sp. 524-17 TaxID=2304577 RepID=UPI00137A0D5A|nr:amidohydrolase [Pseudoflavonifractor sp. 524-17]NCE64706.1 amidohydrolase [Pseudoflavonifractor sp. 524-17]